MKELEASCDELYSQIGCICEFQAKAGGYDLENQIVASARKCPAEHLLQCLVSEESETLCCICARDRTDPIALC